ncbi:MAG: ATP-binding cassette domain-containing protein [Myxococcota bacterium]
MSTRPQNDAPRFRHALRSHVTHPRPRIAAIQALVAQICDEFGVDPPVSGRSGIDVLGVVATQLESVGFLVRRVSTARRDVQSAHGVLVGIRKESGMPCALVQDRSGASVSLDPNAIPTRQVPADFDPPELEDTYLEAWPPSSSDSRSAPSVGSLLRDVIARGFRRESVRSLLLAAAGGGLTTALPIITGILVESVIPEANTSALMMWSIALLLFAIAGGVFSWLWMRSSTRFDSVANLRVQWALAGRMPRTDDTGRSDRFHHASLIDLAGRSLGELVYSATRLIALLLTSAIVFVVLLSYDLGLASRVALVPGFAIVLLAAWQYSRERRELDRSDDLEVDCQASLHAMLVNRDSYLRAGLSNALADTAITRRGLTETARQRARGRQGIRDAALAVREPIAILLLLVSAYGLIVAGDGVGNGAFVAFSAAFLVLAASGGELVDEVMKASHSLRRLLRANDALRERPQSSSPAPLQLPDSLTLERLAVRPARSAPIIASRLDLSVNPGEVVVIFAPIAGGKTALVDTIVGRTPSASGRIGLGEVDTDTLDAEIIRDVVAVLPEEVRCEGTVHACLGAELTQDEAREVVEALGLHSWLESLSDGLQTPLGEELLAPTSVVARRLGLGRALTRDVRLRILDDPFRCVPETSHDWLADTLRQDEAACLLTTSDADVAARFERVFHLANGSLRQRNANE